MLSHFKIVFSLTLLFVVCENSFAENYPNIYPFVPVSSSLIESRTKALAEDDNVIINIFEMHKSGLTSAQTKIQPWSSTYWPLNQGMIANRYRQISWNPLLLHRRFSWSPNHRRLSKQRRKLIEKWYKLDNDDLEKLSPAEKYDLLLGDTSLGLTGRILDYMKKWGENKEYSFLQSYNIVGGESLKLARKWVDEGNYQDFEVALADAINKLGGLTEQIAEKLVRQGSYYTIEDAFEEASRMAQREKYNYVLEPKNGIMGIWEGICHGWATASAHLPRPVRPVDFIIKNNRRLRFFPDDIKALASLLWANSLIQDNKPNGGVIMQGLRCNSKSPAKDEWGRYYDAKPDKYSGKLEARCVGVHPAIWHLGLVNIIGKQGRSFVVERKVKAAVDNHPMRSYSMKFFNPYNGEYGTLASSTKKLNHKDQFFKFRNTETKMIVGVKLKMRYMDWQDPKGEEYDSPAEDKIETVEMFYDLELNRHGDIIGGQWRTTEVGSADFTGDRTQPDFFWVITKDWKKFFPENTQISAWNYKQYAPPKDWLKASLNAQAFNYEQSYVFNNNAKCNVIHKETGKALKVPCEFKFNRPQPLVNVVNTLIELSRR